MSRLQLAIDQIVFARNYTLRLLEKTPTTDWLRQPPGAVSNIGWQVGHLAFSEYRLALWRIRGALAEDDALFSPEFRRLYGANSVPEPNSTFSPKEIQAALVRVHEQVLRELPTLSETALDEPVSHPHPFATTKLRALLWCAHHEMLHAGQIGLLRRHLGHPPMW
jgi:DinB superfamily